jgi:hypothetical protein
MNNYYTFKKWALDDKPCFALKDWLTTTTISWSFAWLFYNEDKDVTTKDGKNVTIPASISVVLEKGEDRNYVQVRMWTQARAIVNSLINVERWAPVELNTYISWGKYKVISVRNPEIEVELTTKEWKAFKTKQWYNWAFTKEEIPEVDVIRNKKWEFVSQDDSEANEFFKNKIKNKFSVSETMQEEVDHPF